VSVVGADMIILQLLDVVQEKRISNVAGCINLTDMFRSYSSRLAFGKCPSSKLFMSWKKNLI